MSWRPSNMSAANKATGSAGRNAVVTSLTWTEMVASPATFRWNMGCTATMAYQDDKIRMLMEDMPKEDSITKAEAERILVQMYRIERNSTRVAVRMGCSGDYVLKVVRRHAPDLISRGRRRGASAPMPEQVFDLHEARKRWRAEGYQIRRAEQDARMTRAYHAGDSLREIAQREGISRDAVRKRILGANPDCQ